MARSGAIVGQLRLLWVGLVRGPGVGGAEVASVQHDHGDESFGLVEAVGVAAGPADDWVVGVDDTFG